MKGTGLFEKSESFMQLTKYISNVCLSDNKFGNTAILTINKNIVHPYFKYWLY